MFENLGWKIYIKCINEINEREIKIKLVFIVIIIYYFLWCCILYIKYINIVLKIFV